MLGSYRGIFIALGGLALAGAQQPSEQPEASGRQTQQQTSAAPTTSPAPPAEPTYRPYAGYNPDPCYRAENHDSADLCAQWRAALAAEKAAAEAGRATDWAIIATILSAIGVGGLIYTLWQTHGALREAKRSNLISMRSSARATRQAIRGSADTARALEIAQSQFELSERSSKIQLRGYLVVDRVEPYQVQGPNISAKVYVRNAGQTPARVKTVLARMWLSTANELDPLTNGPETEKFVHFIDWLAQGREDDILVVCREPEMIEKLNEADKGDVYVYGRIDFEDVFGDTHWMTF